MAVGAAPVLLLYAAVIILVLTRLASENASRRGLAPIRESE